MELITQFAAMDAAKPIAVSIEARLAALKEETAAADADIRAKQGDAEQREALKEALRHRLALGKERDELLAQKKANNAAAGLNDPNSDALAQPDKFSSSTSPIGNPRHLLFLTDIITPLDDNKVLLLLSRLELRVLHIWRDAASPMICVELPVFGAVVGAMRRLDFLDGTFANVRFTNEKPKA